MSISSEEQRPDPSTPQLIDSSGDAQFGIFDSPVNEINYRDFELYSPLGRRRGKLARWFGFKQFQFLGALSPRLLFGCALADTNLVGTAFVYLYDPVTNHYEEHSFRPLLARGLKFDQRPEDGSASFSTPGAEITMQTSPHSEQRSLHVDLASGVSIDAQFNESEPAIEPMRICTRSGATGWVYARKTAGQAVTGTVRWRDHDYDLAALGTLGHNDWSAGYMRRRTYWNWSCLAARDQHGAVVGLNAAAGVNETGFTENCFWRDGKLHKIDSVNFHYDRRDLMKPWRVTSYDGCIDLRFEPVGSHRENVNALVAATNFNQLFGRYSGVLKSHDGQESKIDDQLGYMESHYAKW
jgi:hypothetical protein